MGWWISLMENEEIVQVEKHTEGGTITVGGSKEADMSLTYNYAQFYFQEIDKEHGLRWIHEKKAKDTVERLKKAVKALGTKQTGDYWEVTKGNAGHALNVLLGWAKQHPEATWRIS